MRKLFLMAAVTSLISTISFADTVIIEENTPNPGDTTTHTTYTTGSTAVTDNLVSQDWTDGSWTGSMFPDSSDINESIYLTGKDGKYAESVINSQGILTENELKEGLTSTFKADIRWWNQWESTVTMTQTATDTNGSTTQILLLEDTTNHNYHFNNYQNTLVIAPDEENTHGTLTARFDFDIDDNAGNWNGGHSGVDVVRPEVIINYLALTSQSVSTVVFCYQKNPPTCPAQEEIADVTDTIDEIFEEDYSYEDTYINTEYIEYEYDWNDDYFYDDIYEEEEYFEEETAYYLTDDFFFEDEYYDDTYYDDYEYNYEPDYVEYDTNIELEEFDYELNEDYYEEEYSLAFDDLPIIDDYFDNEEMYFEEDTYFDEDMYIDAFTDDEFIEDFDEMFEEMPMEEMDIEMAEEMFEEMFEEYFEEPPMEMTEEIFEEVFEEEIIEEPMEMAEEIIEEPMEEDIIEEEPMDEPPMEEVASVDNEPEMEKPDEVEEQPSSESPVADEPEETADDPQQEEIDEEPTELAVAEGSPAKEPDTVEQDAQGEEPELETELDFKIAAIEKVIKSQIKNTVQRTTATLNVINEIVSREMISQQPDMSSYFNMNAALFDTRQLPSGNPAFFNQIRLDTYDYTIYNEQVAMVTNMVGQDPVVQHEKKMRDINSRKTKVLMELKEMLNARSN